MQKYCQFFFQFQNTCKKIASWWHFLSSKKCQNYTWLSIDNSTKNSTPKQDFHCIIMSLRYDRKLILKLHTSKIAYWSENAHFYLDVALHKGQLISKCLFGVFNSSKNDLKIQTGAEIFHSILEELKKPKCPFEIKWPLATHCTVVGFHFIAHCIFFLKTIVTKTYLTYF